MKTVRTMAIFGIVWFSVSFLCMSVMQQSAYLGTKSDVDSLAGWGYLGLLYALAFAIVVVVKIKASVVNDVERKSRTAKLLELGELRQKGILSEDEFQILKMDILRM